MHLQSKMHALLNHDLWNLENRFQFYKTLKVLAHFFLKKKISLISSINKDCETVSPIESLFSIDGKIFKPDMMQIQYETFKTLMIIQCNSNITY